jgi:hypothetical protein
VGTLCNRLWWSNVKILTTIAGVLGSNPRCELCNIFHADILERLGSNLVFKDPFGTSYMEFRSEVCTVRKMDLILRSIERRPQMQFSMARRLTLQLLRRYSVKFCKMHNFRLGTP